MTSPETDLDQAVWPPILQSGETGLEKKARLKAEAEAKRVSDNIDKEIERDRQRRRREAGPKILLLGA
jgi:guanine nucleotide-binding protein subunit alpha